MARRTKLNVNRIIANNPHIDVEELMRSMKVVKDLVKSGLVDWGGYNLDAPYTRRSHTKAADDFHITDTHVLTLKRRRA